MLFGDKEDHLKIEEMKDVGPVIAESTRRGAKEKRYRETRKREGRRKQIIKCPWSFFFFPGCNIQSHLDRLQGSSDLRCYL